MDFHLSFFRFNLQTIEYLLWLFIKIFSMLFLLSLIELSSQLCYNQAMMFNKLTRKSRIDQYLIKKMIAFRQMSFIKITQETLVSLFPFFANNDNNGFVRVGFFSKWLY